MDIQGKNTAIRGSANASFNDQHFLVNFIMSTYLGPDVYSDNPRWSASHRLAQGLPPYTPNNMGSSFLSISQLESLYYYVLRNAHSSVVLKPNLLYMYLKGNLHLLSSEPLEDNRQFTSFFPLNLHDHKRYSSSYEIVKGIVLIEDPNTSYMKKKDLERFKYLSATDDLKVDRKECLSYQHGYQKGADATEPTCMTIIEEELAGTISSGNGKAMFGEKYKRRRCAGPPSMPALPSFASMPEEHNEGNAVNGNKLNGTSLIPIATLPTSEGPASLPVITLQKLEDCISDESVILTGTARRAIAGPQVGVVDIGVNKDAYFFQVALPGVRRDFCQFSCEIESDGKVHIQGSMAGGKTIKKRSCVFKMKSEHLCPPGPFSHSFTLPGPVEPRLFSPNFRTDGIFEAVIIKQK